MTFFDGELELFFDSREVPGTDVSSSVETDKENEDLDDTDQLLDSTYDVNKIPKLDGTLFSAKLFSIISILFL